MTLMPEQSLRRLTPKLEQNFCENIPYKKSRYYIKFTVIELKIYKKLLAYIIRISEAISPRKYRQRTPMADAMLWTRKEWFGATCESIRFSWQAAD